MNIYFLGFGVATFGILIVLKVVIFRLDSVFRSFKSIKHKLKKTKFYDEKSIEKARKISI